MFLLISGLLGFAGAADAQAPARELHIAAAADLQPVLPKLAAAYEHATGVKLIASFGSSATLTQQILNGAPEDVFLSADREHPEQIAAAGQADGSPSPIRTRHPRPLGTQGLSSPTALHRIAPQFGRDPHCHRQRGARAVWACCHASDCTALKLTEQLKPKLVIAENVAQTAQFAASGNAQVAFISLTLASSDAMRVSGSFVRLPPIYPPIQQCGIVLKSSKQPEVARQFLQWLTSPATQSTLPTLGLEPAQ